MPAPKHPFPDTAPPVIAVCWDDANYTHDDIHVSELGGLVRLYEVGFLVKETPTSIVLCCEYQPDSDTHRLALTIPKHSIIWKRTVKA